MSWDRIHFKINPDWTNCRSVTSASATSTSKDEFSQHQDSSSTDAATKTMIHYTYQFKMSSGMQIPCTARKHTQFEQLSWTLIFCSTAAVVTVCTLSLSSQQIIISLVYTGTSRFNLHDCIIFSQISKGLVSSTFVFSRKNIFKDERSICNLFKINRRICYFRIKKNYFKK